MASKQISGKPERYYVKNGSLFANSDYRSQNVLVKDVADLQRIKNDLEPGCIAHYAGRKDWFELGPDHQWYSGTDDGAIVWSAALDGANTTELFTKYAIEALKEDPETDRYELLDKWFEMLQDGWAGRYYTLRYENALLDTATGDPTMTPMGDLKGKSPAPCCTDADEDFFHWMDEDPMYWYVRFNALSKQDGTMDILAIEGIDDTFDITGELGPVYTGSMALWVANYILGNYEYKTIATKNDGKLRPLACDVAPDGEPRHMSWHATFGGSLTIDDNNGDPIAKLTSGAYSPESNNIQYSTLLESAQIKDSASSGLAKARNWNEYEGLFSDTERDHFIWLWQFRHYNLSNSGILEGCSTYYVSCDVAIAETDTDRIIVDDVWYNNIEIGSRFIFKKITNITNNTVESVVSKEHINIDGVQYCALKFNTGDVLFSTIIDEQTPTNTSNIQSRAWFTGTTEMVPGHKDGSIVNCTNGRFPARIAGIEILDGAYSIGLDPIVVSKGTSNPMYCEYNYYAIMDSEQQGAATTPADIEAQCTFIHRFESNKAGWKYVYHYSIRNDGMLFPDKIGTNYNFGYKSAIMLSNVSTAAAICLFGKLDYSVQCGLGFFNLTTFGGSNDNNRPRLGGCGKKRGVWNGFKKSVA